MFRTPASGSGLSWLQFSCPSQVKRREPRGEGTQVPGGAGRRCRSRRVPPVAIRLRDSTQSGTGDSTQSTVRSPTVRSRDSTQSGQLRSFIPQPQPSRSVSTHETTQRARSGGVREWHSTGQCPPIPRDRTHQGLPSANDRSCPDWVLRLIPTNREHRLFRNDLQSTLGETPPAKSAQARARRSAAGLGPQRGE